jgi:hypothetical protein
MPAKRKQDNSTYQHKVELRRQAMQRLSEMGVQYPIVMETHGGIGKLFDSCYAHLECGVVFEKNSDKASTLGKQRPTWAVYECDCIEALRGGVGGHYFVNLLDVDPYGQAWEVIDAFFTSDRQFEDEMIVVVNDGLRQSLSLGKAWDVKSMKGMVLKFGNDLHPIYLDVCRELMEQKAAKAGYKVNHFGGYYCGANQANTHFMAVLCQ